MPFTGLAPSKLKNVQTNLRVGYVYIEESFDTIFNMGYRGIIGRENRPWTKGLRNFCYLTNQVVYRLPGAYS